MRRDRLGVLQAEKAEALIRELRQQNAKGEEYFEREKVRTHANRLS